jgi:hypothetical protein
VGQREYVALAIEGRGKSAVDGALAEELAVVTSVCVMNARHLER